jgi:selenocysteine-specific elongation factor
LPTLVIGTAGHIDHGKTALLRALTGIDADRLPEEKSRGMTLDVGYAHLAFEDGVELDFVDVPGHDRLIGNMLVGAGEIDAAMLVVAADDGPRPQTLEHLELLDALGIRAGVAVITKIDLVDEDRVEAVSEQVRTLLLPTWLASIPILAVSSATGDGIPELRSALRRLRDDLEREGAAAEGQPGPNGPLRLAVDRAFTAKGRGTVVTGSLRGGSVHTGDSLRREPGGRVVRVREVQVHGAARDGSDGGRTALNLGGDAAGMHRGDVLTTGPRARGTDRLLLGRAAAAPAHAARSRAWPPKQGAHLRLHVGTDQVDGRIRRIRGVGDQVLLDLERQTATFPGDRAILREPGSGTVAGGMVVLDLEPPRGISSRRMTPERLDALAVAVASGDTAAIDSARIDLHGLLADGGADVPPAQHGSARLATDVRAALEAAAIDGVTTHRQASPLSAGWPLPRARAALLRRLRSLATVERANTDAATVTISRLIDSLAAEGRLVRVGDVLRDPEMSRDGEPTEVATAMDRLEAALAVPAPPPLGEAASAAGCPPDCVRALQGEGRIVRIGPDLAWATPTYHRLAGLALDLARETPLTPAAFRDATETSRRYVLAILEDLDRRGVLLRTPEGHVPGPRAPRAEARSAS